MSTYYKACLTAAIVFTFAGCSSSSDNSGTGTNTGGGDTAGETGGDTDGATVSNQFEIELINLTNGQTFSEPALILHPDAQSFWSIGEPASEQLELLAESGASSGISELAGNSSYPFTAATAAVAPGTSETLTITTTSASNNALTIITRMESTDDGFTGINAIDLSALETVGQSIEVDRWAFDAGTEKNHESTNLGSFTAARPSEPNDIPGSEFNFVTLHPGVASELEPLPGNTSQLNQSRKFDNPVIRIRITRVGS